MSNFLEMNNFLEMLNFVVHTVMNNMSLYLSPISHLASFFIILCKIHVSRSCRGLSFKTQALYVVVFITRHLNLFFYGSLTAYIISMKVLFLCASLYIIFLMKVWFRSTNDPSVDTFRVEYLIGISILLALWTLLGAHAHPILEFFWTFSKVLESVAILPQLVLLQRTGEAKTITPYYLVALGAYRAFCFPDWISGVVNTYRCRHLEIYYLFFYYHFISDIIYLSAGLVQTGLYLVFLYFYVTKVLRAQKSELPNYAPTKHSTIPNANVVQGPPPGQSHSEKAQLA